MSRTSVAALFADLLAPVTPATSATHATNEHRRGSVADSASCDTLRHLRQAPAGVATVAACRNHENAPQSEQRRGLSQVSQVSQSPGARIYRLSRERADAAHLESWTAATIIAFNRRHDALIRRGFSDADAEGMAERLHVRDIEGDDRVTCTECAHLRGMTCGNAAAADVGRDLPPELARGLLLHRCPGFDPEVSDDA